MEQLLDLYAISITWSGEDDAWIATCPNFPEMSAFGSTREEALAEGKVALGLLIEDYLEDGEALPGPRTLEEYSGRLNVRMPRSLHAQLTRIADADGVSLNTMIVSLLSQGVGQRTVIDPVLVCLEDLTSTIDAFASHARDFTRFVAHPQWRQESVSETFLQEDDPAVRSSLQRSRDLYS